MRIRSPAWLLLLVVVSALAYAAGTRGGGGDKGGSASAPSGSEVRATVARVVDGDTIRVRFAGQDGTLPVRYIGMDTPESVKPGTPVQCFAKKASAENERLLAAGGDRVRLRFDAERHDRYGRLLAYVYRASDGELVNAELVRAGYARTLTIPPNTAHEAQFAALQRSAQAAGRGMWSACG